MRRLLITPMLLVLALCLAGPVSAAAPERNTFVFEGQNTITCDGFDLVQDFVVVVREKIWFDAAGDPTRLVANIHWRGTLTNTGTGLVVRDNASWTDFFDFGSGEFRQAGLIWNLNIPGQGVVALDAGLLIFHSDGSVTLHGPHQVFEGGDALLCSVMS